MTVAEKTELDVLRMFTLIEKASILASKKSKYIQRLQEIENELQTTKEEIRRLEEEIAYRMPDGTTRVGDFVITVKNGTIMEIFLQEV